MNLDPSPKNSASFLVHAQEKNMHDAVSPPVFTHRVGFLFLKNVTNVCFSPQLNNQALLYVGQQHKSPTKYIKIHRNMKKKSPGIKICLQEPIFSLFSCSSTPERVYFWAVTGCMWKIASNHSKPFLKLWLTINNKQNPRSTTTIKTCIPRWETVTKMGDDLMFIA